MAEKAFESIMGGLEEALEYSRGNKTRSSEHRVKVEDIDLKALREKLNITQRQFAELFAVSLSTIRNWEQGRRRPEGPARVLIKIISKDPQAVLNALK